MGSIMVNFVPKFKTTPMLAKVLTPRIRSNIGSSVLFTSSIMSGLILKYLDFKYVGNHTSNVPTLVVLKVQFVVF